MQRCHPSVGRQVLSLNLDIIFYTTKDGRLLLFPSVLHGCIMSVLASLLLLHLSKLSLLGGSRGLLLLLGSSLGLGRLWGLWSPGSCGLLLGRLLWCWRLLAFGDGLGNGGFLRLLLLVVFLGLLDDTLVAFGAEMVSVRISRKLASDVFGWTYAAALVTMSHSAATFSKSIYSLSVRVGNSSI